MREEGERAKRKRTDREARQARLGQKLRDNLLRRKEQQRAKAAEGGAAHPDLPARHSRS